MEIEHLSRKRYAMTMLWALLGSIVIIIATAGLARATLNIKGALLEKPEIAVYLLLPDEHITHVEILREDEREKDLLVRTEDDRSLLVKMKKDDNQWYVAEKERLH